jgi:S1-C subfamily serine protease
MDWTLRARILETASEKDLAVLRVEGDFPGFAIVPMGDSDKLKLGDTVYTLSYPEVAQGSLEMTSGVVLSLIRENGKLIYIMTDAMASPGSSGGVAINAQGELIGIVTAILEDKEALEKLGYPELSELTVLVPVNEAKPLVAKAMQK